MNEPASNDAIGREETIFNAAVQLRDPAKRATYLDLACEGAPALRARLEKLLAAEMPGDLFFSRPAALPVPAQGSSVHPAAPAPPETGPDLTGSSRGSNAAAGDRIGRYKLLEKIGEGGMGVVFMAEQEEPVRRKVALKLIKPGMDSRQVIARFEAERQALALMDHPNIARILDAGIVGEKAEGENPQSADSPLPASFSPHTSGHGRPYFAMELVQGVPITQFCEVNQLPIKERLQLFIPVCQAIQSAHQKGVIHRDLKPSNVLVTLNAGKPHPMVIDFGVAKATNQKLTEKTLFTNFATMIGTPAYMSPEQAELSKLDVDTRSDIYALGVLLYELLTGTTPFPEKRLRSVAYREMQRIIVEEEPERPSTRLSQRLISNPQNLNPKSQIDRDLDWIVMKCLEKDRARRYETANGLAADLQRQLSHEPIVARPPSRLYRLRKTVQRNKVACAAAAVVLLALVAGLSLASWALVRERAAWREATIEAAKSRQVAKLLKDMIRGAEPSVAMGRDTAVLREIADQALAQIEQDRNLPPEVQAEMRVALGGVYHRLSDYPKAEAMHRETLARMRRLSDHGRSDVEELLRDFACVLEDGGKHAESETVAREALALSRQTRGSEHPEMAEALQYLARALNSQGKSAEAEPLYREALDIYRKVLGPEHEDIATGLMRLAQCLDGQGRVDEAESLFQQSLAMTKKVRGDAHPAVASLLHHFAEFQYQHGKLDAAEALWRESLVLDRKYLGSEHYLVARRLNHLGVTIHSLGRPADAEPFLREALAVYRKLFGEEHGDVANSCFNLGVVLAAQNRFSEAETLFRLTLAIRRKLLPPITPELEITLLQLAQVLEEQQKFAEAEPFYREMIQSRRQRFPAGHEDIVGPTIGLARLLTDWSWTERTHKSETRNPKAEIAERAREAERLMRECLAARLSHTDAVPWKISAAKSRLGSALVSVAVTDPDLTTAGRETKLAEAETLLLAGNAELQAGLTTPQRNRQIALQLLVRLYEAWPKPEQLAAWRAQLENLQPAEARIESAAAWETPR